MQLGSMAQFLSTGVRECSQFVVFLTALLHALPQLIKRSVGLCIGCDDPAHHFLGAFDYATRRYQSHAFDRRVKIADNLRPFGLVVPGICQASRRFNNEFGIEFLPVSCMVHTGLSTK
jgi:hypothetical protein